MHLLTFLKYMRRSSRKRVKIDYVALNEAKFRERDVHHHWDDFINFNPKSIDTDNPIVQIIEPTNSFNDRNLSDIINESKLTKPILIKHANPEFETYNKEIQLDFKFPNFTIDQLNELIGGDTNVPVMNVMTQDNLKKWDFNQWNRYFKSPIKDQIMNVISLEVSSTDLGSLIELPKIVKELDIVTNLFTDPELANLLLKGGFESPKVQKYILMSVKGCLTDFHIDFAATSVYYSPILGHKKFIMFPPLKRNLDIYKRWCLSSNQNDSWLPDLIPPLKPSEIKAIRSNPSIPNTYINNGLTVEVKKGDLLLLPSGWIHAVITLEDSLVYGGNFLNLMSLGSHLEAYQLEMDTQVGENFKFPQFITFMWLFAYSIMHKRNKFDSFELDCIEKLANFLHLQYELITNPPLKRSQRETRAQLETIAQIKSSLPYSIIGKDVGLFVDQFDSYICSLNPLKRESDAPISNHESKALKLL